MYCPADLSLIHIFRNHLIRRDKNEYKWNYPCEMCIRDSPMAVSKVVSAKMAIHQYKIAHKVFKCALIYVLVIGGIASLITFFGASVLIPSNQPKDVYKRQT